MWNSGSVANFTFGIQILSERATLYDYELIVGDHGKRLLAFGKFAGRAGMIDFLRGLGQRMNLILAYFYISNFISCYVQMNRKLNTLG